MRDRPRITFPSMSFINSEDVPRRSRDHLAPTRVVMTPA
jgi:hypothetical protein